MRFPLKLSFLFVVFWSGLSGAEVSFEQSRIWHRARTAPAGQQLWNFQTSYQKVSDRFSGSGKVQALGKPYSRTVTWSQLLANETAAERGEMESFMTSLGASEDDIAAIANYEVEREETGFRIDWAYGLMKRWTIGFDVPLVYRKTQVKTRVDMAQNGGHSRSGMSQKVRQASETELVNSGFDSVPDQRSSWDFGDIGLMSQVSLWESYRWQWALQQVMRFPTARNPDLDNYIQTNDDSGQVDLGVTSLLDYRVRRWILGTQLGYVAQLPDSMRTRVSSTSQSRKVDPKVSRDLGDYYFAAADGEYVVNRTWRLNVEYSYLNKMADKFKGRSAEGFDYAEFGKNTDQDLHQTRVGVQYQIGATDARAGVENKWIAAVGYNYPWLGRNSLNASRTSVDLISYF